MEGRRGGSYRHDAVVDQAAHLHVIQVAVVDVRGHFASSSTVGAQGRGQPLHRQGLREEPRLQLRAGQPERT